MTFRASASAIAIALVAAALAACAPPRGQRVPDPRDRPVVAPAPEPEEEPVAAPPPGYREGTVYPRTAEEISGPAVLTLMERARSALQIGRIEQAIGTLERALDIEPRNPFVWQRIAEAHLRQHLPEQAENKAQRSNSFAHGNPYVELQNWRLIAEARTARGDVAGAEDARSRAGAIQAFLED